MPKERLNAHILRAIITKLQEMPIAKQQQILGNREFLPVITLTRFRELNSNDRGFIQWCLHRETK